MVSSKGVESRISGKGTESRISGKGIKQGTGVVKNEAS